MGNIGWIKLSTRIFDDEKIQIIEKMPEGHAILLAWIKLLVLGAQGNGDGTVRLSETIPYTDEMLSVIWRLPVAIVRLALQTFGNFGMIELHPDQTIEIANWGAYQQVIDLERIRALGRERSRRFRARRVSASNDTTNKEKETRKRLEGNVMNNVTYTAAFEDAWEKYPRKVGKQAAFRKWKATLKKGAKEEELICAVKGYATECKTEERENRYIKHGATFFGPDEHWRDYLNIKTKHLSDGEIAAAEFGR